MRRSHSSVSFVVIATFLLGFETFAGDWSSVAINSEMAGWDISNKEVWKAEEGVLTGKVTGSGTEWILGPTSLSDLEIRFEYQADAQVEMGLLVRTEIIEGKPYGYNVPLCGKVVSDTEVGLKQLPVETGATTLKQAGWQIGALRGLDGEMFVRTASGLGQRFTDDQYTKGRFGFSISGPVGAKVRIRNIEVRDWAAEAGYTSLFNGEDLSGWVVHGEPEQWSVEGNLLLGESVGDEYGYLATVDEYKNFSVVADFFGREGGNSGLFFHSKLKGTDITGIQAEVEPNYGGQSGFLYESGGRGWLIKSEDIKREQDRAFRPNEWNTMRVDVTDDNHIRTWLNGMKMTDMKNEKPLHEKGVIALQIHSGGGMKLEWRNIQIRVE